MVLASRERLILPKGQKEAYIRKAIPLLDLTNVNPSATALEIGGLCLSAVSCGTAAVCVSVDNASLARSLTKGKTKLAVAAGGFPRGSGRISERLDELRRALDAGADELDVVLNLDALQSGDFGLAARELSMMRAQSGRATMKVIIESGMLDEQGIRQASRLAIREGADFLKTSTGFEKKGASPEAVRLMLGEIVSCGRKDVGIKPSGGIRTADEALEYMLLAERFLGYGCLVPERFRLGASALLDELVRETRINPVCKSP